MYHHWGLSEGKQGNLNFDYYRSHTDVYELAKEVGLLVIARPGVSIEPPCVDKVLPINFIAIYQCMSASYLLR